MEISLFIAIGLMISNSALKSNETGIQQFIKCCVSVSECFTFYILIEEAVECLGKLVRTFKLWGADIFKND